MYRKFISACSWESLFVEEKQRKGKIGAKGEAGL